MNNDQTMAWIPLAQQSGLFAEIWKEGSMVEDFDIVARLQWQLDTGLIPFVPQLENKELIKQAPLDGSVEDIRDFYKTYSSETIKPYGLATNSPTGRIGINFSGFSDQLPESVKLVFLYPKDWHTKGVASMTKWIKEQDKETKQSYLESFNMVAVVVTDLPTIHLDMPK